MFNSDWYHVHVQYGLYAVAPSVLEECILFGMSLPVDLQVWNWSSKHWECPSSPSAHCLTSSLSSVKGQFVCSRFRAPLSHDWWMHAHNVLKSCLHVQACIVTDWLQVVCSSYQNMRIIAGDTYWGSYSTTALYSVPIWIYCPAHWHHNTSCVVNVGLLIQL